MRRCYLVIAMNAAVIILSPFNRNFYAHTYMRRTYAYRYRAHRPMLSVNFLMHMRAIFNR